MAVARTVLGDIPAEKLGFTMTHEHLTFSWGSGRRDLGELYDREGSLKLICADIGAPQGNYRINTIVDVSTAEMGRDVDIFAEVQRRTGVNIIASTGSYRQNAGISLYWNSQTGEKFEELMVREITEGVGRNKIKCGNIKMAWASYQPTPTEEKLLRAAGRVSRKLGTSIVMHTPYRNAPPDANPGLHMIDILVAEGADPTKITIGHAGGVNSNLKPLLEVLRRGAFVCFEGGNKAEETHAMVISTVGALISAGYAKQIMLSLDHLLSWQTFQPASWNPATSNRVEDLGFLPRERLPRMLKAGIREKDIEQMMVTNPRNFLSF